MKNQFVRNNIRSVVARHWITFWRVSVSVVIGTYIVLMLVGCAGIGPTGGKYPIFAGRKEPMLLQVSRPDILDIIAEVGKSMGYSVSALNKEANTISLSPSSSGLNREASQATLTISSKDNGKNLDIEVFVIGNFGTGGQKAAMELVMKLVNNFKRKLLERIGE